MRGSVRVALVVLFSTFAASSASASSIAFTETFDPADVFFESQGPCASVHKELVSGECDTLTWTYIWPSLNPLTDTISSAILTLEFADDGDQAAEKFDLWVDGSLFNNLWVTATSPVDVLSALSEGTLTIALARQLGDFWFRGATLTATGDRADAVTDATVIPTAAVPEPGVVLLLFSGAAAAIVRRRRSSDRPADPAQ